MEAELKSLEGKLDQFVQLCHNLRTDNQQLRQQLALALDQRTRLEEKLSSAAARLEALLGQIPAEDEA
jgi:cell division protein ZapB